MLPVFDFILNIVCSSLGSCKISRQIPRAVRPPWEISCESPETLMDSMGFREKFRETFHKTSQDASDVISHENSRGPVGTYGTPRLASTAGFMYLKQAHALSHRTLEAVM